MWIRPLAASVKIFLLSSMLYFLFSFTVTQAQEWHEMKGEHFFIYYQRDEQFASDVLRQSESYYRSIASELGYQRYSGFWTWENRVKIYIFPDKESFRRVTGQSHWSEGMADYTNKSIVSYAWNEGFLEALLPHEITHLVFRDYVGIDGKIPLWIDEGVAQWMEPKKRELLRAAMEKLIAEQKILSLDELMRMDVRQVSDSALVQAFYVEAASLVGFLIREHGSSDFINFCRQLRDKKNVHEALIFAYPTSVRTLEQLEGKWLTYYGGVKK